MRRACFEPFFMPILISQLIVKPALTAALAIYLAIMGAYALLWFAHTSGIRVASGLLPAPSYAAIVEPAPRAGTAFIPSIPSWSADGSRAIADASSAGKSDGEIGQGRTIVRSSLP